MKKVLLSILLLIIFSFITPKAFAENECSYNIYPEPTSGTHTYTVTLTNNSGNVGKSIINNFYDGSTTLDNVPGDNIVLESADSGWDLVSEYGYSIHGDSENGLTNNDSVSFQVTLTLQEGLSAIDTSLTTDINHTGTTLCSGHIESSNFTYNAPGSSGNLKIEANPSTGARTVGSPFTVDVKVSGASESAFNAARANVAVSSNLTINSIHPATSNSCNLQYTQTPSTSNPSFAGAIFGDSSEGCTVYTMTLTPNAEGTGTVTFTNGSVKSYEDNSEILDGVTNASFTLGDGPTPTPTAMLEFAVTSPLQTYKTNYDLSGTKLSSITSIFVNGDDEDSEYPSSTTWSVPVTLALGNNNFTIYGSDGSNQTATQNVIVDRHTLGDINGDGEVDLIDASLFAVDWDKTEDLTYILSDMNDDGDVDLTDLSILAKLQ